MNSPENIKDVVREKYGNIVVERSSCCGSNKKTNHLVENYTKQQGYNPEADYSLGCGIPTEHAKIKTGNTVLDLGSGAGNDVFVARSLVGDSGYVIGVDFTENMIKKANENKAKLGFGNIDFRLGDIENLPVEDNTVDVVISNCVINLVPDKNKAFAEIFRVLKPGGHLCISDMVLNGEVPDELRKDLELYAGCVAGAVSTDDYSNMLENQNFVDITIAQVKTVINSRERVEQRFSGEKADMYWDLRDKLHSITFLAVKP